MDRYYPRVEPTLVSRPAVIWPSKKPLAGYFQQRHLDTDISFDTRVCDLGQTGEGRLCGQRQTCNSNGASGVPVYLLTRGQHTYLRLLRGSGGVRIAAANGYTLHQSTLRRNSGILSNLVSPGCPLKISNNTFLPVSSSRTALHHRRRAEPPQLRRKISTKAKGICHAKITLVVISNKHRPCKTALTVISNTRHAHIALVVISNKHMPYKNSPGSDFKQASHTKTALVIISNTCHAKQPW